MNEAILIPTVSVGPIRIGDPIANYPDSTLVDEFDIGEDICKTYLFAQTPVEASVYNDGNIESIQCEEVCIWKGVNLIGLEFKKFLELDSLVPDEVEQMVLPTEEGEQTQDVYDFDNLGLQVWVFENLIVTVIAMASDEK